jgi:hypothetical protein
MKTPNLPLVFRVAFVGAMLALIPSLTTLQAAAPPQIFGQPSAATYSKQAAARFYVNAASVDGGYLTYQWYRSGPFTNPFADPNGADKNAIITHASKYAEGTTATLTTTTPNVAGYFYYWVEITNYKDGGTASIESIFALTKVVDRLLPDELKNGDFEHWYMPGGIKDGTTFPAQPSQENTFYAQFEKFNTTGSGWLMTGGEAEDTDIFNNINGWYTTHQTGALSYAYGYVNSTGSTPVTGGYIELGTPSRMYGLPDEGHGFYTAELNADVLSTLYQTVGTVPGKIYEWSLDYGTRSVNAIGSVAKIRLAVVIGKALNGSGDYDAATTTNNRYKSALYPYGLNNDTYFNDIVSKIANPATVADGIHMVTYNGSTYYVYLMTINNGNASQRGVWFHHSGVYTVPTGQGTTVFGFVGMTFNSSNGIVMISSGNNLDNVSFASGSPLLPEQNVSFTNIGRLSVPTKAGYAYGLAELRGSSLSMVSGLSAFYDPDGEGGTSPEAPITETAGLGTGDWYTTDAGNTAFETGGLITFKGLVPGKTYRIVGIPAKAINPGLNTNMSPMYVLDEGYYADVRILSASAVDDPGAQTGNILVETYFDAGAGTTRARITLEHARNDVEYALLADNAGQPKTDQPVYSWVPGDDDDYLTFDNLDLDTRYYLVARPRGYVEITYAAADSPIPVRTPAGNVQEILPADLSRNPDKTSIILSNSVAAQEYAVVDPETGTVIEKKDGTGDGSPLTFTGLDASKAYQVRTRLKTRNDSDESDDYWLKGVRVFPYPDEFTVYYAEEVIRSAMTSENPSGHIPTNVEYRIQAEPAGIGNWIAGDVDRWALSPGNQPIDLASLSLAGGSRSILDTLETLDVDAVLTYRFHLQGWSGYPCPVVVPEGTLSIPKRPAPPVSPADYTFNYAEEKITAGAAELDFAETGSPAWTSVAAAGDRTFAAAGWGEGAAKTPFRVRFPATASSFASSPNRMDTIPARPRAPVVGIAESGGKIYAVELTENTAYEYYKNDESMAWTDLLTGPGETQKELAAGFSATDVCHIRLKATATAPASFTAIPFSLLSIDIDPITYSYGFGAAPAPHDVTVINHTAASITVTEIKLTGDNADCFSLTAPTVATDKEVAAGATNTNWKLTPAAALHAGAYRATLEMTYTHNAVTYTETAGVYLTVQQIDWDMTQLAGTFDPAKTKAGELEINITGAPEGATLEYYFGSTPVAGNPSDPVPAGGNITRTFTAANGLAPATTYELGVKAQGDVNHRPSGLKILAKGYTAYATPVFDEALAVDYAGERLKFRDGYLPALYTITYGSDTIKSPYSLTDILDAVSAGAGFTLSLVHNAATGDAPYPASEATTALIDSRPPAPGVVYVTPISLALASDGKISLPNRFNCRLSGATQWESAKDSYSVAAGTYEVRQQATATAFASGITTAVMVPSHFNAQWTGASNGHWHDPANWSMAAVTGNATLDPGLLPLAVANVWIPGNTTFFPTLTPSNPGACNNLYLLPGAQLGGQQHLTYTRAHVQLDLGLGVNGSEQVKNTGDFPYLLPTDATFTEERLKFSAGHSAGSLTRDRWYMLSTPLQGVVSGDYALGDYPRVFMRKFNNVTPSPDGRPVGQWTLPFAKLNEELKPAEGFAIWINGYDDNKYGYREYGTSSSHSEASILGEDFGLQRMNGILELPFYDNALFSAARRMHEYVAGGSRFYYIWSVDPHTGNLVLPYNYDTHPRSDNSYRLIANGADNFTYTLTGVTANREILIGNPFVAAIDFAKFYSDNSSALTSNSFRVWDGDKFVTVSYTGPGYTADQGSSVNQYISPMQSFFVQVKSGTTSLKFNLSATTASASGVTLRAADAGNTENNMIRIAAANEYFTAGTLIARREQAADGYLPSEDVYKLFSQKTYVPEVYTVVDRYALAMNFVAGERELLIPIGLKTTFRGETTFTFTGMDRYEASQIEFLDLDADYSADITGEADYTYVFDNQTADNRNIREDRFFLRIRPLSGAGLGDTQAAAEQTDVRAFLLNGEIRVVASPSNPIRQVEVYDLQGRLLHRQTSVDVDRCTIPAPGDEKILLLRIVTDRVTTNVKLIK